MAIRALTRVVLLVFAQALTGCDDRRSTPSPAAPSPVALPPATLQSFLESSTGFSTTDLRDADDQILQLDTRGHLIWTPDGTRLPGYSLIVAQGSHGVVSFIQGNLCDGCGAFEVRFGTAGGERRAYLTVDYGHDNPGTLVDVDVANSRLVVTPTEVFAPGSYTLSGEVTELISGRAVPVAGVWVYRAMTGGWQGATTNDRGIYALRGMYTSNDEVNVTADGFKPFQQPVPIAGDTRFDIRLVR
jgi:hypothetical protein